MKDIVETSAEDTPRIFVNGLYEGILKRPGDPDGIGDHLRELGISPSFADATALLTKFVNSTEAKDLAYLPRLPRLRPGFDSIISIGSHCITSGTLQRFGLKQWSGPFDWVFSNIGMATHCIENDFEVFLDRRYHYQVPEERRIFKDANKCDHLYYKENFGVNFVFNHYDITTANFAAYYDRCVERFRAAVYGERSSLLINVSRDLTEDQFRDLCEAVDKYTHAQILCIRCEVSENKFGVALAAERGNHRLYEMQMLGDLGPVSFTSGCDEMMFYAILSGCAEPIERP